MASEVPPISNILIFFESMPFKMGNLEQNKEH